MQEVTDTDEERGQHEAPQLTREQDELFFKHPLAKRRGEVGHFWRV